MIVSAPIKEEIEAVFSEKQAPVLIKAIDEAYNTLVKVSDFQELKKITAELAEAQKASEKRLTRLETSVAELTEAQKASEKRLTRLEITVAELTEAQKASEKRLTRLEITVAELTEAQKRTEEKVERLIETQESMMLVLKEVVIGLDELRQEVGGLSRSVSYGFENEAYRMVPGFLKDLYGIEMTERFVRKDINNREINLFGKARKNGHEMIVVGESKLRLGEKRKGKMRRDIFEELQDKVEAVKNAYPNTDIVKVLITHFATDSFLKQAEAKGIIVIQSFEW